MSKSTIYVANTTSQDVSVDGTINLGSIIRRFGPNLNLRGSNIQVAGAGYYDIDANFTVAPTADSEVTITAYRNNVPIPGATATETAAAAGDTLNLSINAIVREGCSCCDGISNISFVLTGVESAVTNAAIVVEKL